jgi:hypothetical protein
VHRSLDLPSAPWTAESLTPQRRNRPPKNALSRYLAAVRDGQELVVTDHGRPVARMEAARRRGLAVVDARG